jgi:hypothetical protein
MKRKGDIPAINPMAKAKNPFRTLLRPESIEASFFFRDSNPESPAADPRVPSSGRPPAS